MSVNSYLTNLANAAIIRDQEKESIRRSISTLQSRLTQHFGTSISRQFIFGSYSRGTILPRSMDEQSDIDYMVVFSDSSSRPQTYLDRLRRFVEMYYSRSEISQSNPTIVLSLNHIRFELVPAIDDWWSGLKIPAKASEFQEWIDTDPTGFNQDLINANRNNDNQIKRVIRLVKYWNAKNRYPFESYSLEQDIVQHGFWGLGFYGLFANPQLKDYFYDFVKGMEAGWLAPKWKQEAVSRAKQFVQEAEAQESQGYIATAETTIKRLLPPPGLLGGI